MRTHPLRRIAGALILTLLGGIARPECRAAYSLADILSAPFESSPVAAPSGTRVAWIVNAEGRRNVLVASEPDWVGRPVTSFTADDGEDLSQLGWTSDESGVFFSRGGEAEHPNAPATNAAARALKPAATLWLAPADGSGARAVGEGISISAPAHGQHEICVRSGEICLVDPTGNGMHRLVDLTGTLRDLQWSPSGDAFAFANRRGDHAFIAVYRFSTGQLRFLDPGLDTDQSPVWSPDGTQIAFIRASEEPGEFGAGREGEPFSLRVADVASGAGHELWRADRGPGSIFQSIVGDRQLLWDAGGGLVFPWEKDGWLHLYRLAPGAGTPTLLTPGAGEVQDLRLGRGGREALYSSNIGDLDRRHLWRVSLDPGGAAEQITSGTGIEVRPATLAGHAQLAYLAADGAHPPRLFVRKSSGADAEAAPMTPASYPAAALVPPQPVTIAATDAQTAHGQLFLPPAGTKPGRHPALVYLHGGSRRQMLLGFHFMEVYTDEYAFNQYLASQGYLVLSVNYRSGTGYGLSFRQAVHYGAGGASELADVTGAANFLRARSDVDPNRIGLWGKSYGGYLTALALAKASDRFAAGVDINGVHDWPRLLRREGTGAEPDGSSATAAKLARESSPLAWIQSWRSPVLLIHGDDDRNVPFEQSVELARALGKAGIAYEQLVFPDEVHAFLLHRHWVTAYGAAADFLGRKLAN